MFDDRHECAGRGRGGGHGRGGGRGERGGFGGGGFRGGPPGWIGSLLGHRPRARRGNVRAAILSLLGEQALNGYQIMQAIEERSHGMWRPSSGSIYPTLQLLEDEGLVDVEDARAQQGSSRTYKLTTKGKRYVEEHREELAAEWAFEEDPRENPVVSIMQIFRDVATAAMQVAQTGTPAQVAEAKQLLADVRRKLYGILAAEPDDADE